MNQGSIKLAKKKLNIFLRKANLKIKNWKLQGQRLIYNTKNAYQKLKPEEKKKYKLIGLSSLSAVLVLSLALGVNFWMNKTLGAFEVSVDGQVLAVVREEATFWSALETAKDEIAELYHQELDLPSEVQLKKVRSDDEGLTKETYIVNNIKRLLDIQIQAVAITVDGEPVVLVPDLTVGQEVLDALKDPYINSDQEYVSIDFKEKVDLVGVVSTEGVIRDKEDALNYLLKGTDEEKVHVVQKGENTWLIARQYDLTVEEIAYANPGLVPEKLQIGQEISLVIPKPYISVVTKEYVEMVEPIPFETVYEETDSLYKGDRKIITQGVEGEREIKGYIIKENGEEVDREILEETIFSEPQTRVVAEGTKPRPKTMATGLFANPSRGRLSSRFGMRWGSMHKGIDIANSIGTPIYAADGGVVTFSGKNGSFGNLIIINHENGYETYYAHCSKLLVSKGERVYKGQHIANVGNTGRSTGPHLHFEVRKNGTPVNPLSYVSY